MLQAAHQHTRFGPRVCRKWWRLYLAVQPNQWFISSDHRTKYMSILTYSQSSIQVATAARPRPSSTRINTNKAAMKNAPVISIAIRWLLPLTQVTTP